MSNSELLDVIQFQHRALIDATNALLGVRLSWAMPHGQPEPAFADVLALLADNLLTSPGLLVLPVPTMQAAEALRDSTVVEGLWVEFPLELALSPPGAAALNALHESGAKLISQGRLPSAYPLAGQVTLAIEPAAAQGAKRVVDQVRTLDEMEAAFKGAAQATLGWPVQGPLGKATHGDREGFLQVMVKVIKGIDNGDDVDTVSALLDQSPTLAFRLLRYLNSPACGLRHEMTSVRHAIMMLGYRKLREWIAMLLASAVETPRTRSLTQASMRRAFFMQELANRVGSNEERGDLFVCGMFSLLDRALGRPMTDLLKGIPLSDEIKECLLKDEGPLKPFLDLSKQVEGTLEMDFYTACEATAITPAEVNFSLLRSLGKAASLA
jgi:c-di-GMP phosphodiesterase